MRWNPVLFGNRGLGGKIRSGQKILERTLNLYLASPIKAVVAFGKNLEFWMTFIFCPETHPLSLVPCVRNMSKQIRVFTLRNLLNINKLKSYVGFIGLNLHE